jgi:hypothetical protein
MPAPPLPPDRIQPAPDWSAGPVTRLSSPPPAPVATGGAVPAGGTVAADGTVPVGGTVPAGGTRGAGGILAKRRLWWFAGAAGMVLATGLVAVLVLVLSGNPDPFRRNQAAPADVRPPLAQKCPPPGSPAEPAAPSAQPPGAPAGPRTVDAEAGISYRAYGAPWRPWPTVWNAGTLQVPYRIGQHFVTEPAYDGVNDYHATILSAAVPAADNDALAVDIECVGRQVAADARAEYYPQPNRMEVLRDGRSVLAGRPAWVTVFRLHFQRDGLRATDELAAVACIDVGRPTAAVLYVSVPGTHRQFDWVVNDVIASVRTI